MTHMRVPNDQLVARETRNIDLFLGGHDHIYHLEQVGNNLIVKSGSDFKSFNVVTIVEAVGGESVPAGPTIESKTAEADRPYEYVIRDGRLRVSVTKRDVR